MALPLPPNFRLNLSEYVLFEYIFDFTFREELDSWMHDADKQIWSSETHLRMRYKIISDRDVIAISKFTELEVLDLTGSVFTEPELGPLANLKQLTDLSLTDCRGLTTESGSLARIEALVDLPNLLYLDLTGTHLPDIPVRGFFKHSLFCIDSAGRKIRTQ